MTELRTSISINLDGNLERAAARYTQSMRQFSSKGSRYLHGLSNAAATTGRALDRVGNRYTAFLTGAAAVGTVRQLVSLEARLTQLGINADVSAEGINKLKKEIFETAQLADARVNPDGLIDAIEEIVKRTGRLDIAQANLANMARTMRATGAEGVDVGATIANLFEKFDVSEANAVLRTIDSLSLQGKAGAFELKDFATQMNEVAAAYAATGRKGPVAVREMGAMLQMIMRTSGSAAEASTNFQRLMSTLTSEGIADLRGKGIEVFDAEQLKKGVKEFRPIPDIIKDIIKASGGDEEKLAQVFDLRAMKAIRAFALEFKSGRGFESFDKFLAMQGSGGQLLADSARNAATASAALTNLYSAWKKFADESLTGPIQSLADLLNALGSENTGKILKVLGYAGLALGGAVLARKTYNVGKGLFGKGAAGAAGGALGGMPLPLPVFVTNPGAAGGLAGAAGGAKGAGRAGGLLKRFGSGAVALAQRHPLLATAGLSYAAGTAINKGFIEGTTMSDVIGRAVARMLAALGNDSAQAALNSERRANELKGTIKLEVTTADGVNVRSRGAEMDNDVDVEVESGLRMGGAW